MKYRHGNSLCVSTQVGCRMGCAFCASTIGGLVRNLSCGEILGQVYAATRDIGERIGGVVLMGVGEPLDNLDNVVKFLRMLSDPKGTGLSLRHVSLSTCGRVDGIEELARYNFPLTLSVSLHASDDETRNRLMPVNRKWNLDALMNACRAYDRATGRRISFEYTMIDGVNDSPAQAATLAVIIGGIRCHVNLIPHNPVEGCGYRRSKADSIERFRRELAFRGVAVTVRRELGGDLQAACGQLRRNRN